MPPRSHSGDLSPMNDSNSFSFQIPGSILHNGENLLAEDDGDFFGGADVDMSTGTAAVPSPLKGHSQITTRRVTRSQSRSPQKQQPPRSAKKSRATTMTVSSSTSFPASTYQGLNDELLMEVEEMEGMNGIDSMDADDSKAPFEPIAAELNKPRSSSRRSKSPSKSKAQTSANESLTSMSAYLPPPSPDASRNDENDGHGFTEKLHPNAFNFNFSPETRATQLPVREPALHKATVAESVEILGTPLPIPEQGPAIEATATTNEPRTISTAAGTNMTTITMETAATSLPERKIPTSRIERRVTSRSKRRQTEEPPTTTTTTTTTPKVEVTSETQVPRPTQILAQKASSVTAPTPVPTQVVSSQPQHQVVTQTHTDTLSSTSRTFKAQNPFDALKKRVASADYVAQTEAPSASSSNSRANVTSSVGERLAQYGQRVMGGSFSLFKSPRDSQVPAAAATSVTATSTTQESPAPIASSSSQVRSAPPVSQAKTETKDAEQEQCVEIQRETKATVELAQAPEEAETDMVTQIKAASASGATAVEMHVEASEAAISAAGDDMVVDEQVAAAAASTSKTLPEPVEFTDSTTTSSTIKPASTSVKSASKPKSSRVPSPPAPVRGPPAPPGRVTTAGTQASTMASTQRSAVGAPKAGLNDKDKASRANVGASANAKKRGFSDAQSEVEPESAPGAAAQPPVRKRARRDSVMLGKAAPTGSASTSRRSLPPPSSTSTGASFVSNSPTTTATTAQPVTAPTAVTVNTSVPTVMEESEPEVEAAPAPSEVMDVDTEVTETIAEDVDMRPPSVYVPATAEPMQAVEAETAVSSAPPPAPGPTTVVVDSAKATRKASQKCKREEEAQAPRRRDEAKRQARREQQKVLRQSIAVIAAAAAATVVAAVAADGKDEDEGQGQDEGGDDNEGEDDGEDRLPAPNFVAPKPADARNVKAEPKGKAKAKAGEEVKGGSKKRTTNTSAAAMKAAVSRSTAASSSKATAAARMTQVQTQVQASRKIATNSRINRGKEGHLASSATGAEPSPSTSSELQKHANTQTRSHSRAGKNTAAIPGLEASMQAASGSSSATSSASSSSLKSRPPFQVPLPATLPGEFAARTEVRREARRREKQCDAGETAEGNDSTNANPATCSSSQTSSRNSANAKNEKPPIPDFAAMHAAQAALLTRAKASLPPLTKPHGPALTTEARMKERAVFDAHIKEKEAEEERKRDEERRRREEEEELEIKELRKRAVPKAHEVPEWYRDMPKKTKTAADSGDQPSSSTS